MREHFQYKLINNSVSIIFAILEVCEHDIINMDQVRIIEVCNNKIIILLMRNDFCTIIYSTIYYLNYLRRFYFGLLTSLFSIIFYFLLFYFVLFCFLLFFSIIFYYFLLFFLLFVARHPVYSFVSMKEQGFRKITAE